MKKRGSLSWDTIGKWAIGISIFLLALVLTSLFTKTSSGALRFIKNLIGMGG